MLMIRTAAFNGPCVSIYMHRLCSRATLDLQSIIRRPLVAHTIGYKILIISTRTACSVIRQQHRRRFGRLISGNGRVCVRRTTDAAARCRRSPRARLSLVIRFGSCSSLPWRQVHKRLSERYVFGNCCTQALPQSVALVFTDSSSSDGTSDAFASDVAAAAVAAAALDASGASSTVRNITLTVLQRVLAGSSARNRSVAFAQLPCLTSRLSLSGHSDASHTMGSIVAAAAAAALSLSASLSPGAPAHPLTTASHIVSSAASRVGNLYSFLALFSFSFDPCVFSPSQDLTLPSMKLCHHYPPPSNHPPPSTHSLESLRRVSIPLPRCASLLQQQRLLRAAAAAWQRRSVAC
jgi:hypothetical protein